MTYLWKMKASEMSGDRQTAANDQQDCGFHWSLLRVFEIAMFFSALHFSSAETANSCAKSQFLIEHADGSTSCEDCAPCPPGQGLSHECGTSISSNTMVTCVPCQPGVSFSRSYDTSSCTPCTPPCLEDQVVLQNCTPTKDIRCAKQCYSKDRYYDHKYVECLACSKCCGDDEDVEEDECKQKMGAASNMICSFHSSINRCDTTTASVHDQHVSTTVLTSPTNSLVTPSDTSHFITQEDPKSLHAPTKRKLVSSTFKRKKSPNSEAGSTAAIIGVPLGVILVVGFATYFLCKKKRCKGDIETGSHQSEAETVAMVPMSSKDGMNEKSIGDDVKLEAQKGSNEPLLGKDTAQLWCECQQIQKCSGKDSKLLGSLLEHENALQRICEALDTSVRGWGNYKAVAQHYGFDYYKIKSVFEKYDGGPSRALIEAAATGHPKLTVEEFAVVVEKKTKRGDVSKLLREYDSAVEENKACELCV